ncbi:hypothetical protein CMUS01_07710 [Colletotrichum musicola]|uniref:Uncharacterized protein n=1 Tax=Colletotrichum musicola TaxID=2175873 RepID=A0A8H6KGB3_9PEZI|nr:hypothetical protein CMUS01_07710 [Colletotrichum musicola]
MKAVIVITALVSVVSAGIPRTSDTPGRDLFTRQNACTKADSEWKPSVPRRYADGKRVFWLSDSSVDFCNDGDAFFTRCCDGLKCVVEQIPQIGRTKVCQ